jgi:hypothetical protein
VKPQAAHLFLKVMTEVGEATVRRPDEFDTLTGTDIERKGSVAQNAQTYCIHSPMIKRYEKSFNKIS